MKTISIDTLLGKIRNSEINVLGFVVTPWHLVGVRAFIEKIKDEGKYNNHLIIVGKHLQTGYVFNDDTIPDDAFVLENNEIPIIQESFMRKNQILKDSQKQNECNPLYVVSPWNYRIETTLFIYKNTLRKCRLCKIDEGVATYMFTSNSLYLSIKNVDFNLFFKYIGGLYAYCLLRNNINCNLLIKRQGCLIPNECIIPYYKKTLNLNHQKINEKDNEIVIATMAFSQEEVFDNELEVKIKKTIDLLTNLGYTVIIKPHPRENDVESKYARMNCFIADKSQSMEKFFMDYRPFALISMSSTCLITAKLFFNIKTISITNLLDINNFSQVYKNELLTFKKVFPNMVIFPNSFEELSSILQSVSQNQ